MGNLRQSLEAAAMQSSSLRQIYNALLLRHGLQAMLVTFAALAGVDKSMAQPYARARFRGALEIKFRVAPRGTLSRLAVAFAALILIAAPVSRAPAQELSLIRDAETEALIADYT